ncbi:MAG: hypothetical protein FK733_02780 [Asgard group archaeon]|nr:hypothetical protein [Asgard group archaeon]
MKISKSQISVAFIVVLFSFTLVSSASLQAISSDDHFFKVRILVNSNSDNAYLANLLSQELKRIRIDSLLNSQPGGSFESAVLSKDFDVVFIDLNWPGIDVDSTGVFSESGAGNYWGIDTTMAFGQENEELLLNGTLEVDEGSRIGIYHDWQENLMDNILPVIPLYNPINRYISWNTLTGWDQEEGIISSLPYMEWSSAHYQQENTSVFIDYTDEWDVLNPLFMIDDYFIQLISEPLIRFNKNGNPVSVLAENWSFNSNQTKLTFTLRDNIYWQPDIDKLYENEPLTTEDILFSVQMYRNVSNIGTFFEWIVDYEIESDLVIHFYLDGDSNTPGLQPYAPSLHEFTKLILPEHYLNVSVGGDGLPDTGHANWGKYGLNGLGTGMYHFVEYLEGVQSLYYRNEDWWGTRADAFNDDLDILEYRVRFLPDLTALILDFENGHLDIFKDYRKYMTEYLVAPYQSQTRSNYDVTYLGFNMKSSITPEISNQLLTEDGTMSKGLAVRKAIAHIIDKTIINDLLEVEVNIIESPLSGKFGDYVKSDITTYAFDLDRAKEFMIKAGYDPGTLPTPNISFIGTFVTIIIIATVSLKLGKKKKS